MLAGAAVFGLFALGFGLATIAAALATFLATWLALLLTFAGLLLLAGALALLGRSRIREGTPPVPEQAVREAKLTKEAITGDGRT
jgi:membrane protein implicated in regulation of membrane protease activity